MSLCVCVLPAAGRGCGHRAGTSPESRSWAGWPKCSHAQTKWCEVKDSSIAVDFEQNEYFNFNKRPHRHIPTVPLIEPSRFLIATAAQGVELVDQRPRWFRAYTRDFGWPFKSHFIPVRRRVLVQDSLPTLPSTNVSGCWLAVGRDCLVLIGCHISISLLLLFTNTSVNGVWTNNVFIVEHLGCHESCWIDLIKYFSPVYCRWFRQKMTFTLVRVEEIQSLFYGRKNTQQCFSSRSCGVTIQKYLIKGF